LIYFLFFIILINTRKQLSVFIGDSNSQCSWRIAFGKCQKETDENVRATKGVTQRIFEEQPSAAIKEQ